MGDEDRKKNGMGPLGTLVCLGLGAAAGWFIAHLIEEEKKEQAAAYPNKPKPCKFEDTCTLCLEKFNEREKNTILACTHVFHQKCFEKIRSKQCPLCRERFS